MRGFCITLVFTTVWQLSHHGGSTIQNTTNVNDAGGLSEETSVYRGVCKCRSQASADHTHLDVRTLVLRTSLAGLYCLEAILDKVQALGLRIIIQV